MDEELKKKFALPRASYIRIIIGFVVVLIGFMLMMGDGNSDPNVFNYDIFSFRRITLAPIVVLIGFGVVMWGIMRKPKSDE